MATLEQTVRRDSLGSGRIACVFLTCFRSDFAFLANLLHYSGIRMHRAETVEEADFLLTVTGSTVFLSDVTFVEGTWRDALAMAGGVHPLVASLIVADPVDWPYLSDAFSCGACAVVWKPVDLNDAIHMIRVADQASRDRAIVHRQAGADTPYTKRASAVAFGSRSR